MKLEPVFLLAPEPAPPSMPTRRAFLLAGGMFAAGSILGGSCGYALGVSAGRAAQEPKDAGKEAPAKPKLEPSGDVELDYWRRLAVEAPLDELFSKASAFLSVQLDDYRTDAILWVGIDRLTREVIGNPARRVDYRVIAAMIENIKFLAPPTDLRLRDRMSALDARRQEERRRK